MTCHEEDAGVIRTARLLGVEQPPARQYLEVGRSLASADGGYDVLGQGFRYHLANLHAAIGLTQLLRLPEWIENRRQVAAAYSAAFAGLPVFVPPADLAGVSLFGYTLRVPLGKRDELRRHLLSRGVDSGVHWRPGHWLTWLKECRGADRLPVSNRVGGEIMTLPLWGDGRPGRLDGDRRRVELLRVMPLLIDESAVVSPLADLENRPGARSCSPPASSSTRS